jgi:hypothetical protein
MYALHHRDNPARAAAIAPKVGAAVILPDPDTMDGGPEKLGVR